MKEESRVELSEYIKEVILRHCPVSDNRIHLLGSASAPCLDIKVNFKEGKTRISFLHGTSRFKMSTPESATCEYYIDFEDIKSIMDFILKDHEAVKFLALNYPDEIRMGFSINWNDSSLKGMMCSDIHLKLDFNENRELRNNYLHKILNTYSSYLEELPDYIKLKENELQNIKRSNLIQMNKEEMLQYLDRMSEDDLRELLLYADNNLLIKYVNNEQEKKLTL